MSCYYLCDTCARDRHPRRDTDPERVCPKWMTRDLLPIHDGQEPREACGDFEPLISKPRSEAAV